MGNEKNLKPFGKDSPLTEEEQRAIQVAGGKASGKARAERKAMREMLLDILDMPLKNGELDEIKSLEDIQGKQLNGKNITVEQALLFAQVQRAMKGDTTAFAALRDTSGQKPSDTLNVSGGMPVVIKDDVTE